MSAPRGFLPESCIILRAEVDSRSGSFLLFFQQKKIRYAHESHSIKIAPKKLSSVEFSDVPLPGGAFAFLMNFLLPHSPISFFFHFSRKINQVTEKKNVNI